MTSTERGIADSETAGHRIGGRRHPRLTGKSLSLLLDSGPSDSLLQPKSTPKRGGATSRDI
jgi:hypothetical protein